MEIVVGPILDEAHDPRPSVKPASSVLPTVGPSKVGATSVPPK
jgi:hypothetical protein